MSIVAVDTGGTFTDVVYLRAGRLSVLKLPSTPADPARAVLEGISRVLALKPASLAASPRRRVAASRIEAFVLIHGSTVATNALLERRGARVALVTNRGLEDVLEIGRQNRPQLYALVGRRPPPLVPAEDRHGIAGRLDPRGAELEPLDDAELERLPARVARAESIAVCLLHSYADPGHERRVGRALAGAGIPLSLSSELLPEYREYERMATTVANAYVAPRMDRYLARLEAESGAARVRVMGSGGGAVPVARARREAVHTILSGPAGGVMGGLEAARRAGFDHVITFDMGGTSTDVSLCPGRPLHTREFAVAGTPVAIPVVDIHTVGAGGGSIAHVDAGGALRVGPESAGADPGPVSYGRGGRDVTVTDAHVWLGRLPAHGFLGGERPLDRAAIEAPLRALAERLGTNLEAAAEGVLAVADTAMEGALRVISVERGHDPADFTLVAFGGAAPLHAAELADRLGLPRVLVPPDPGLLSAYGMLGSPVRKDAARTVLWPEERATPAALREVFVELERAAAAAMAEEGIPRRALRFRRAVDARYRGQSYELHVPATGWLEAFHRAHEARYGYARRDAAVEAVTLRVEATAPPPRVPATKLERAPKRAPPRQGTGGVVYEGRRMRATHFERRRLLGGHRIAGPAVVLEYSATTWLPPGWRAEVQESGALLLERAGRAASGRKRKKA
ncbi:MAG: hydantoinase/oxoprolinase family protein [Gemmatimonadetes bacterium]|nr:hydantoinase/oxoprolinase family protein [Gemmatimonadota bacterium]